MEELEIRRILQQVLSDPAFRAQNALGLNAAQRDSLATLEAQMAQLLSDRSLQAAIGNQLWIDGVSIINGTITAPKIDVENLEALAILTGDLTIDGVLTLSAGGRIEDADGSIWDQDGITLQVTDTAEEALSIIRTGQTSYARFRASVSDDEDILLIVGTVTDGGSIGMEIEQDVTGYGYLYLRTSDGGVITSYQNWTDGAHIWKSTDTTVMGLAGDGTLTLYTGPLALKDGITAPATASGYALIYVHSSDGDLKVKFGDGTVKTIVTDT